MNVYERVINFIRSHDRSTPENPRRDGTYGYPKQSKKYVRREIEPIFDADLNLIEPPYDSR